MLIDSTRLSTWSEVTAVVAKFPDDGMGYKEDIQNIRVLFTNRFTV